MMGVWNTTKTISVERMACNDRALVTLTLTAGPERLAVPLDLVLVLDVSGSMRCAPLEHMKAGAAELIRRLTSATGGISDRQLGGGSRVGVVSFSGGAAVEQPLTSDVTALLTVVEGLKTRDATNHAEAFRQAAELLGSAGGRRRVLVLFTDGGTNWGGDPATAAREVREAGIEIFCIGLHAPEEVLYLWASEPEETHVATAAAPEELERLFAGLGGQLSGGGVQDAVVEENLVPDFVLRRICRADRGRAAVTGSTTLRWEIGDLGRTGEETATLIYELALVGDSSGVQRVTRSTVYRDRACSRVRFPELSVFTVGCGVPPLAPEPCPVPVDFCMGSCQDAAAVCPQELELNSLGRMVRLDVTLRNICPGKRVALAVLLTEVGPNCGEYSRGMKYFTIPAHHAEGCRDVRLKCIRFVVPEDLVEKGCGCSCCRDSLCRRRCFRVRLMANYVDTDFTCCGSVTGSREISGKTESIE